MNLGMLSPCDFVGIDLAYNNIKILRSEIKDIKTRQGRTKMLRGLYY